MKFIYLMQSLYAFKGRPMLSLLLSMGALKMLDVKLTDQCAGHEIAGRENDGSNNRT